MGRRCGGLADPLEELPHAGARTIDATSNGGRDPNRLGCSLGEFVRLAIGKTVHGRQRMAIAQQQLADVVRLGVSGHPFKVDLGRIIQGTEDHVPHASVITSRRRGELATLLKHLHQGEAIRTIGRARDRMLHGHLKRPQLGTMNGSDPVRGHTVSRCDDIAIRIDEDKGLSQAAAKHTVPNRTIKERAVSVRHPCADATRRAPDPHERSLQGSLRDSRQRQRHEASEPRRGIQGARIHSNSRTCRTRARGASSSRGPRSAGHSQSRWAREPTGTLSRSKASPEASAAACAAARRS